AERMADRTGAPAGRRIPRRARAGRHRSALARAVSTPDDEAVGGQGTTPGARQDGAVRAAGRIARWWARLGGSAAGRVLFAGLLRTAIPYTGTIRPHVEALGPGHARVRLRDRRGVRNHLGSIHAVALTNLGELASGLALVP